MKLVGLLLPVVVVASSIQNYVEASAATPVSPDDNSGSPQQIPLFNLTDDVDIFPVDSGLPGPTSSTSPHQDEDSDVDEDYQAPRLTDDIPWDLIGVPRRRTNKVLINPWTTSTQSATDDHHVTTEGSSTQTSETEVTYLINNQNLSDIANVTKVSANLTTSTEYPKESQFQTVASVVEILNVSTEISPVTNSTEPVDLATASTVTTTMSTTTTDPALNLEPPYFSRNQLPLYPHREDEMFHRIDFDPNNPYSHWDSDSEEQEREMELQRLQDEPEEKNMTLQISSSASDEGKGASPSPPQSENTAEVERLDENVMKEEAPLHMLAETNATLLELSGEEYHVVRLLPLRANPPTPESEEDEDDDAVETSNLLSDHHGDVELVIYTAIGGACAIVIFATLLITVGRYLRVLEIPWPWRRPKSFPSTWNLPNGRLRHHRMGDEHLTATSGPPPTVIYSGSFAARAAAAAGASWVDDYQPQPNNILAEDPALGAKLMANNPMYADLEMGGNMMTNKNTSLYPDAETTSIISHHRPSPSKLHIFSCRPGSLLIPLPPHRVVRKNLAQQAPNNAPNNQKKQLDTHPLDVRIGEDGQGHDNPNYQT